MTPASAYPPFKLESETMISTDTPAYGLGGALLQLDRGSGKTIANASQAMSPRKQEYAKIEKEALATCWARENFTSIYQAEHRGFV